LSSPGYPSDGAVPHLEQNANFGVIAKAPLALLTVVAGVTVCELVPNV
jgi:predicted dithiol-disulfide oxidoreductase (DUF899 family)